MPRGILNGVFVDIPEKNKIGSGGEGDIYIGDGVQIPVNKVLKVYNANARSGDLGLFRAAKLQYMVNLLYNNTAIEPEDLFLDRKTNMPIGYVMEALPINYKEIRSWANRDYCKAHSQHTTPAIISRGFLKLRQFAVDFHSEGMIVGDWNDLNSMFEEDTDDPNMYQLDIDASQIFDAGTSKYWPCPVITQDFGAPRHFKDVITDPDKPFIENILYEEQDDWYSFAANYFKCLVKANPYGGTHPSLKTLPKRAKANVWIGDKDVIYPIVAQPLSILSGDILKVFEDFFANGQRYVFPEDVIEQYIYFAETGKALPTPVYRPQVAAQIASILLEGFGVVVYVSIIGNRLKVITNNNGIAMFHEIEKDGTIIRQVQLFRWIPSANYAFLENLIFVSTSPELDTIMAIDISTGKPRGAFKTAADAFARGSRQFGTTPYCFYRITSGYLMRGKLVNGELAERPLFPVSVNQSRIHIDSNMDRLFGYNRSGEFLESFLVIDGNRHEVILTPLKDNEIIDRVIVRFSGKSCIVLRVTQINGVTRLHIDDVNAADGTLVKHRITSDLDLIDLMSDIPFLDGVVTMDDDKLTFRR